MADADSEQCEAAFLKAIHGQHGCTVDWKARLPEVKEELSECMTSDEVAVLQRIAVPEEPTASRIVTRLANSLEAALNERSLVPLESFGDFAILLLVPKSQKSRIEELANGWLIR